MRRTSCGGLAVITADEQHVAQPAGFQIGQLRVGAVDLIASCSPVRHPSIEQAGDHCPDQHWFGRELDLLGYPPVVHRARSLIQDHGRYNSWSIIVCLALSA